MRPSWEMVKLGEICRKVTDGSHNPPKGQASVSGFLMLSSKNINNNALTFNGARYLNESDFLSENTRTDVNVGDVLLTIVGTVGRSVVVEKQHAKFTLQRSVAVIKPTDAVDSYFLSYALDSDAAQREMQRKAKGVAQKGIYLKDVKSLSIPLPPLEEQRRIVEILDAAQGLIDQRKEQLALMDQLVQSLFYDMFGDPVSNPMGWEECELQLHADIKSGVTKGRKFGDKKTVFAPYMRVANVQDGHLDLDDITEVEVLPFDVEKYKLIKNDILLTEGGDPDKLGRGAIWQGEVDNCIHQNHIFRVRLNGESLLPEYASKLIGSSRGKRYFFKMAKQTTGIASINMGQLKKCPILLPSMSLQAEFAERVLTIEAQKAAMTASLSKLEDTFNALIQRAFKGELVS